MPWLRTGSPRCQRRGAQRRAGTVAGGVHPGMHWPRGRSREGAARRSRDGGEHRPCTDRHAQDRPIPPFCVNTTTASLWDGYGSGTRRTASLIPSRFSQAVAIATKSPLCIHTSPTFPPGYAPPSHPLNQPARPPRSFAISRLRHVRAAAVRRRSTADRYRSTLDGGRPSEPVRLPRPDPLRPPPTPSPPGAVPRILSGFSGFSQASPPLYLQVCECRHSN